MANRLKHYLGMALVLAGVILLIVSYVVGWTDSNAVLMLGWLLVVSGVVVHVWSLKRRGKY